MAKAYKCDRCGKFYTENTASEQTIDFKFKTGPKNLPIDGVLLTKFGYPQFSLDLCKDCLNDFCVWFGEVPDNEH